MPFQDLISINAGDPFENQDNGKYACFGRLDGRKGVYVFVKNDGEFLYVGKSSRLQKRLEQYYRPGDTGITFRENYCDENRCTFERFRNLLRSSKIHVFVADCHVAGCRDDKCVIKALEYALICQLKPKYNKEIQRERAVGTEYIRRGLERMRCHIRNQHPQ